jgi:pimeloyl-ACP methyl ester carboxylesterase
MRSFHRLFILVALIGVTGCKRQTTATSGASSSPPPATAAAPDTAVPASSGEHVITLTEARRGFQTHLSQQMNDGRLAPLPPLEMFHLVTYSTAGRLPAYVSLDPKPGVKHPAIIWLTGGFSNSIGELAWTPGPPDNEQSAAAYREAGVVMMYPALRGGNDSTALKEGFFGEVDDVLAAADYLSKVDYVDPQRIYLGGHSSGGTLALLAAESTDRFRAVFSFGPVDDVGGYGDDVLPFDMSDPKELELRAPGRFLQSIHDATFVFEGTTGRSNILSLQMLMRHPHPDCVRFCPVSGVDHYAVLRPVNRLIAQKILADTGSKTNISFSEQELTFTPAP